MKTNKLIWKNKQMNQKIFHILSHFGHVLNIITNQNFIFVLKELIKMIINN